MQRIHLTENVKRSKEMQCKLNLNINLIQEEVVKLLDVGAIYLIFINKWVSPM